MQGADKPHKRAARRWNYRDPLLCPNAGTCVRGRGSGIGVEKRVHLRGFYGGASACDRPACGSPEGTHPRLSDDRDAVTRRVYLADFGEALFERRAARARARR
jgi:hypothetical protein